MSARVPKPWEMYDDDDDAYPPPQLFVLEDSYLTTTGQCKPGFEVWNFTETEIASHGGFEAVGIRPRGAADLGAPVSLDANVAAAVAPEGYYYSPRFDADNASAAMSTEASDQHLQFYYQQCRRCQVRTFSIDGFQCVPCPAQALCVETVSSGVNGRGFSVVGSTAPLYLPGFWTAAEMKPQQLRSNLTNFALTCPFPFAERCPGGQGSECGSGYANGSFVCGQCSNMSVLFAGKCHECSGWGAWIGSFPAMNLWWWLLLVVGGRLGISAHVRCLQRRGACQTARQPQSSDSTHHTASASHLTKEPDTGVEQKTTPEQAVTDVSDSPAQSSSTAPSMPVIDQVWCVLLADQKLAPVFVVCACSVALLWG